MIEDKFYKKFSMLINTEIFKKEKSPYILCTAINQEIQKEDNYVEFNYKNIFTREDKYKDVVGFYHTHPPGNFSISEDDINTMKQWVMCLNKSLVCLIECDNVINGWLFSKTAEDDISIIDVKANTQNNINYYVWTEPTPIFWETADFLINGEAYYDEDDDPLLEIMAKLENIEVGIASSLSGLETLTNVTQVLIDSLMKDK